MHLIVVFSRFPKWFATILGLASIIGGPNAAADARGAQNSTAAAVKSDSGYVHRTIELRGADLGALFRRLREIGIDLPMAGAGRIDASLRVEFPWRHPFTWNAYRLHGTVDSRELVFNGIQLRDVAATADYAKGQLRLNRLLFTLWDTKSDEAQGSFSGTARLGVSPRTDFNAQISIENLGAAELARVVAALAPARDSFPGSLVIHEGRIKGTVNLQIPYDQIKQLDAWRAAGQFLINRLRVGGFPVLDAAGKFNFDRGNLSVSQLQVKSNGLQLSADLRVASRAPFDFQIQLHHAEGDLGKWEAAARQLGLDESFAGTFFAKGILRGSLKPLDWSAQAHLDFNRLSIVGVHVDQIHADLNGNAARLSVTNLNVRLYEGIAAGQATFSQNPRLGASLDLSWRRLEFDKLARDVAPDLGKASGIGSGNIRLVIPSGDIRAPAKWQATGNAAVEDAALRNIRIRQLGLGFAIANQMLTVSNLRVEFPTGRLEAGGSGSLRAPFPLTGNFNLQDFDLSQLAPLSPAPIKDLRGRLGLTGIVKGTFADRNVALSGSGIVSTADLLGVRLDQARFGYGLSRFGLAVAGLNARLYSGAAGGALQIPFDSRVDGNVDLHWSEIDAGRLASDLKFIGPGLSGQVSGSVRLNLPASHGFDWSKLNGALRFEIQRLSGLGIQNGRAALAATVAGGELAVSEAIARWVGFAAQASGKVKLAAPFRFTAQVASQGVLESLPNAKTIAFGYPVSGHFAVRTDLKGSAAPLDLSGSGSAQARQMKVGSAQIDSVDIGFVADQKVLNVRQIAAALAGGTVTGSAKFPLAADGNGQAAMHLAHLDVGQLVHGFVRLPAQLSILADADLEATIPAGAAKDFEAWDVRATATLEPIRLNGVTLGAIAFSTKSQQDLLSYSATGKLLGGLVRAEGQWRNDHEGNANTGILELRRLQIARLAAAFPRSRQLRGLSGELDLRMPVTLPDKFGWPEGSGELKLDNLHFGGLRIAERIASRLDLHDGILNVAQLNGTLAGGMVRADASIDLNHWRRGRIAASLVNADSQQLLTPWPEAKGLLTGAVSIDLHGSLAIPLRLAATVAIDNAHVLALPLSGFRLPLRIEFDPKTLATQVEAHDGGGQLGHGRLQLDLKLRSTTSLSVEMKANLIEADLGSLLSSKSYGQLAGGSVTGKLLLSGRDVHSLNDLSGSLQAHLRNVQLTALPVLQNLESYLNGGFLNGGNSEGEVRARIGGGVMRLERLTLNTSSARLFASGRISAVGRLDLGVAVSTEPLPGGVAATSLLARLSLAAAGPVGWVVAANELLANQVIYLDVSGTISNPLIRVQPLPLLTTEASRFFLGGS